MRAISSDSHVVEGPDVFAGLAQRFGDDAPRIVSKGEEGDYIVIPSRGDAGTNVGTMALAASRLDKDGPIERRKGHKPAAGTVDDPEIAAYLKGGYNALRPGLKDGSRRGDDQDADGVAAEFLYPGYFGLFRLATTDLIVAAQKNYNDWLHDYCASSNGRLYGLAAIPMQDPKSALDELRRVAKLGYKGVIIPSNAPQGTRYFDAIYDDFWSLAQEAGLPISMHVGCFAYPPGWVKEALARDSIFIYGNSASLIQETLIDLIVRGVCKRFPKLKFVVAEFNAGWIAHWLDRVDQAWQREYGANPAGIEYEDVVFDTWRRQFYATIEDDQPALSTLEIIGADNVMWGSDYPHTDSTFPCSQAVLSEMFSNYSAEERDKVTRGNVSKLYGI